MAFGQTAALRTQTTIVSVTGTGWTKLEGSTPLTNRFAVKVFHVGAGSTRVGLSYDSAHNLKQSSHWLGPGQFVVEPCATGTTLYGWAKLTSGVTTVRVVVVEYGH